MSKRKYINDNVHGLIRVTRLESRIMSQEVFNRLHNVYQNSVAYLTWPSNRVQRFEHSIGTMKLAGEMLLHSVENAEPSILEQFFEQAAKEVALILGAEMTNESLSKAMGEKYAGSIGAIRKEWKERRSISVLRQNGEVGEDCPLPIFDSFLVPSSIEKQNKAVCYLVEESVRVAAMLHDIGHPPFSHAVEKALEDLYGAVQVRREANELVDNERVNAFISAMSLVDKGKKLHEAMGDILTDLLFDRVVGDVRQDDPSIKSSYQALEFYLIGEMVKKIFAEEGFFQCLHEIIDSTVDADRLDFVRRDSLSSGFGIGAVPYSQIIDAMKLVRRSNGDFSFAFSLKSSTSIATFLRQRYQNYDTIVFHHHVAKTEELLRQVVMTLGKNYFEQGSERNAEDDGDSERARDGGRLPSDISGLWEPFADRDAYGLAWNVRVFGQWNDAWFISMLTGEYIALAAREARGIDCREEDEILLDQLASLLYGRKGYASLIKRYEHVGIIDDAFLRAARDDINGLAEIKDKIERKGKSGNEREKSKGIEASAAEDLFRRLSPKNGEANDGSQEGTVQLESSCRSGDTLSVNVVSSLRDHYSGFLTEGSDPSASFVDLVRNILDRYPKAKEEGVKQVLVVPRKLDAGVNKQIYLYDPDRPEQDLDPIPFGEYSNIRKSISVEEEMRPPFFIFVHFDKNKGEAEIEITKSNLLKYLGNQLFQWFFDRYRSFSNQAC